MYIKQIQVQNIRNVLTADITFDENLVKISWENWAWKSTIVDSIFFAILGKVYLWRWRNIESLITSWEAKAEVEVTLESTGKKLKIKRKVTESWNTSLDIRSSDPDEKLYQKDLDNLLSEFTVDPLEFTKKNKKEQFDIMKKITWVDTTRIENEIELQTQKTQSARAIYTEYKKTLDNVGMPERVDTIDVSQYAEELEKRQKHNSEIEMQEHELKIAEEEVGRLKRQISLLEWKISSVKWRLVTLWNKKPTQELIENIQWSEEQNKKAQEWNRYVEIKKKTNESQLELQKEKDQLESLRAEKQKMIQEAKMPIENMEFSETEWVVIKGIPLDQHSSAEQLKIACKIATSMNQELKVIYIKDWSLLDSKSMIELEKFAQEEWYQILCERVWEEADSILMREWVAI